MGGITLSQFLGVKKELGMFEKPRDHNKAESHWNFGGGAVGNLECCVMFYSFFFFREFATKLPNNSHADIYSYFLLINLWP